MRLMLVWPPEEEERDLDTVPLDHPRGLDDSDLRELREIFPAGTQLAIEATSYGKGAAGSAIGLVIEMGERVATDAAGLIAIGGLLSTAVKKIRQKRTHKPYAFDSTTLATLAAVQCQTPIKGLRYTATVPITANPAMGTDERDIWAVVFAEDESVGGAVVIFISTSGMRLAEKRVPAEIYLTQDGWQYRTPEELENWLRDVQ